MVAEEERKGGRTGRDLPAGTEVVFFSTILMRAGASELVDHWKGGRDTKSRVRNESVKENV